jgi:hypothetical protein
MGVDGGDKDGLRDAARIRNSSERASAKGSPQPAFQQELLNAVPCRRDQNREAQGLIRADADLEGREATARTERDPLNDPGNG